MIIFLDVDGVLNSINNLVMVAKETGRSYSGYNYPFDASCLENLKYLVLRAGWKIVIASTWRLSEEGMDVLKKKLDEYGLWEYVIGVTKYIGSDRDKEIFEYIKRFLIEDFIIIDDNGCGEILLPYLIKTNTYFGLTKDNVDEALLRIDNIKKKRLNKE